MKRISVVGPESSGKTTLTKYLSKTLKCNYSEEYARTYLDKKETYDIHDLIKIAKEQNRIITNKIKKGNDYFIADTSCLVIELWSRIKFNHVDVDLKYLSLNENFDLDKCNIVASSVNETNEIAGAKSLEMPIVFTSQNSNVSPVIDLDRRSFIAVANRINNVDSSSDVFPTTD